MDHSINIIGFMDFWKMTGIFSLCSIDERIREKRALLNNILRRKVDWIGHIVRRNCLLHYAIEGQMMEVKGVRRRRRTQILDDLRNRRKYWELKEQAEDLERWRRQFINRM